MRLAFKRRYGFRFTEKEVDITFNIGTLEAACKSLDIEFHQISDVVKKDNFEFVVELLFQGYITACKDKYKKPRYDRTKAFIWNEYLSKEASKELMEKMVLLFGDVTKMAGKKKVPGKIR